jgi:hypothetical protein
MPTPSEGVSASDFASRVQEGIETDDTAANPKDTVEKETPVATDPPSTDGGKGQDGEPEPKGEEPKGEEEPAATYTIGEREFKSVDALVKEANRINGRNANLAGNLTKAEERAEKSETDLAKVLEMNKRWKEHFDALEKGEEGTKRPDLDPEHIAELTTEKLSKRQTEEAMKSALNEEVEHLESLSNYDEVLETVEACADCINPKTGKLYTLREAYTYACKELELEDEWEKEETPEETPEPVKPATPAPKSSKAVKSAAARPSGSGGGAPAPKKDPNDDWLDTALAEALPLGLKTH